MFLPIDPKSRSLHEVETYLPIEDCEDGLEGRKYHDIGLRIV